MLRFEYSLINRTLEIFEMKNKIVRKQDWEGTARCRIKRNCLSNYMRKLLVIV